MATSKSLEALNPARLSILTCPQCESIVRRCLRCPVRLMLTRLTSSSVALHGTLALDAEKADSPRDEAIDAVSTRPREDQPNEDQNV